MPNSVSGAIKEVKKAHNHYAGPDQRRNIGREMAKGAVGGAVGGSGLGPAGMAAGAAGGAVVGIASHIIDRTGKK